MKKIISYLRIHSIVLIPLLAGILLRFLNPKYGSPVLYVNGDEPPNYLTALYIMYKHSIFEDVSIYPPLGAYFIIPILIFTFGIYILSGKYGSVDELIKLVVTQPGYFLFIPRLISAFLGVLTIIVVYKVALIIYQNKHIALLGTILFAVSFNHVQVSNFGRPWTGTVLFISTTLLFSIKSILLNKSNKRYLLLASFSITAAFGYHQVGVFALLLFLLVRILGFNLASTKKHYHKVTFMFFLISLIGIIVMVVLNLNGPQTGFFRDPDYFGAEVTWFQKGQHIIIENNLLYYLRQLLLSEPAITILFILTLIKKYSLRNLKLNEILLVFIFCYFLIIGFSFGQPRYLLPIIFMMAIIAGERLYRLSKSIRLKVNRIFFLTLIISMASLYSVRWNYLYVQKPTFIQAYEWIEKNIPPETLIITTATKFNGFVPAKDVLELQQQKNKKFYESLSYLTKGEYPKNVRNIIYLDQFVNLHSQEMVKSTLHNFPVSYSYIINIHWDPNDTALQLVFDKYQKIVSFSPINKNYSQKRIDNILATINKPTLPELLFLLDRTGPYVDIYYNQ